MRYQDVKISQLKCYDDCVEAAEAIESDSRNYLSPSRWLRGWESSLKDAAQAKIDRIYEKGQRDFPTCDNCGIDVPKSRLDDDGVSLCKDCDDRQILK